RGGRRKNAGRPLGAKNKLPGGKDFTEELKTVVRQYEDSEYLYSNDNRVFEGSSLAFIQSVMRAENLPVKVRLYAAAKAVEYEADAGTHEFDETGKVVLYLPHNGRDALNQSEENAAEAADWYIGELKKRKRASMYDWDRWLHDGIAVGKFSEPVAL